MAVGFVHVQLDQVLVGGEGWGNEVVHTVADECAGEAFDVRDAGTLVGVVLDEYRSADHGGAAGAFVEGAGAFIQEFVGLSLPAGEEAVQAVAWGGSVVDHEPCDGKDRVFDGDGLAVYG